MSIHQKSTAVLKLSTYSLLLISLAGCSTFPTPFGSRDGEFIHDYTLDIIRHVRCEARDAMIYRAAFLMERLATSGEVSQDVAEGLTKISNALNGNPATLAKLNFSDIDPRVYVLASPILKSTAGLKFEFNITENNNRKFSPSLIASTGSSVVTIGGLSASLDRARSNKTNLTEPASDFDSFQFIDCSGDSGDRRKIADKKNYHYPLKGKIDLDKSINTFVEYFLIDIGRLKYRVELAENSLLNAIKLVDGSISSRKSAINVMKTFGNKLEACKNSINADCYPIEACYSGILEKAGFNYLSKLYNDPKFRLSTSAAKTFTDVIKFTTKVSGGIDPSIKFNVARSFQVETLGFSFKPDRSDTHQVTVALIAALPEKNQPNFIKPCKRFRNVLARGGFNTKSFSSASSRRNQNRDAVLSTKTMGFPVGGKFAKQNPKTIIAKENRIRKLYEQSEQRIFFDNQE